MTLRALIVDDETSILNALARLFGRVPCQVCGEARKLAVDCFPAPADALAAARNTDYAVVLADYRMPQMNGVEFLKRFRRMQPDAVRLVLSGYTDLNSLVLAINEAGISRFIAKPWNDYELVSTLGELLSLRALSLENRRLADLMRLQRGGDLAEAVERQRLEAIEPGITQVRWGPGGEVLLEPPAAGDLPADPASRARGGA